jgi:hypothetical protein
MKLSNTNTPKLCQKVSIGAPDQNKGATAFHTNINKPASIITAIQQQITINTIITLIYFNP